MLSFTQYCESLMDVDMDKMSDAELRKFYCFSDDEMSFEEFAKYCRFNPSELTEADDDKSSHKWSKKFLVPVLVRGCACLKPEAIKKLASTIKEWDKKDVKENYKKYRSDIDSIIKSGVKKKDKKDEKVKKESFDFSDDVIEEGVAKAALAAGGVVAALGAGISMIAGAVLASPLAFGYVWATSGFFSAVLMKGLIIFGGSVIAALLSMIAKVLLKAVNSAS